MELLILVVGIVLVWKFIGTLNSLSKGAQATAEVFSEEVLMGAAEKRGNNLAEFKEKMEGKQIANHDDVLTMLGLK